MGTTYLHRRIVKLICTLRRPGCLLLNTLCLSAVFASSRAVILLILYPSSVHAAAPLFPLDPTQTLDSLLPEANRKPAPDFTLIDNNDRPITLSSYKGKVVRLDFWATWCGGCKLEIPLVYGVRSQVPSLRPRRLHG